MTRALISRSGGSVGTETRASPPGTVPPLGLGSAGSPFPRWRLLACSLIGGRVNHRDGGLIEGEGLVGEAVDDGEPEPSVITEVSDASSYITGQTFSVDGGPSLGGIEDV